MLYYLLWAASYDKLLVFLVTRYRAIAIAYCYYQIVLHAKLLTNDDDGDGYHSIIPLATQLTN